MAPQRRGAVKVVMSWLDVVVLRCIFTKTSAEPTAEQPTCYVNGTITVQRTMSSDEVRTEDVVFLYITVEAMLALAWNAVRSPLIAVWVREDQRFWTRGGRGDSHALPRSCDLASKQPTGGAVTSLPTRDVKMPRALWKATSLFPQVQ